MLLHYEVAAQRVRVSRGTNTASGRARILGHACNIILVPRVGGGDGSGRCVVAAHRSSRVGDGCGRDGTWKWKWGKFPDRRRRIGMQFEVVGGWLPAAVLRVPGLRRSWDPGTTGPGGCAGVWDIASASDPTRMLARRRRLGEVSARSGEMYVAVFLSGVWLTDGSCVGRFYPGTDAVRDVSSPHGAASRPGSSSTYHEIPLNMINGSSVHPML